MYIVNIFLHTLLLKLLRPYYRYFWQIFSYYFMLSVFSMLLGNFPRHDFIVWIIFLYIHLLIFIWFIPSVAFSDHFKVFYFVYFLGQYRRNGFRNTGSELFKVFVARHFLFYFSLFPNIIFTINLKSISFS